MANSYHCYFRRNFKQLLTNPTSDITVLKRQGETSTDSIPIFDQHIGYLKSLPTSVWILPLGVFTIGMRYKEAIKEFLDLVTGLMSNIVESIIGKPIN